MTLRDQEFLFFFFDRRVGCAHSMAGVSFLLSYPPCGLAYGLVFIFPLTHWFDIQEEVKVLGPFFFISFHHFIFLIACMVIGRPREGHK